MTEDADGPREPTRSDGADGSASDGDGGEPPATDAATNGDGEAEPADEEATPEGSEAGREGPDADDAADGDGSTATGAGEDGDADVEDTNDTDAGADDGTDGDSADIDEVVDRRSPYAADAEDGADGDDADADEGPGDEDLDGAADGEGEGSRIQEVEPPEESVPDDGSREVAPEPPGGHPEEDEGLTAAEKGMQTVENVGNALGGVTEGPESDQEMPLTEHIEEMMRRLSAVFLVAAIVSGLVLFVGSVSPAVPSAAELIRYFWDYHVGLPSSPGADDGYSPYVYGPLEYLLTKLKVVGLAGLLAGLPMFVYQTYRFMRPGLYPHERRYYLAAVPTSLVLGIVGAAFAHFAVLPFVFDYFISYTVGTAQLAFGLKETFNLILIMMGYFAIVFQIPLFIQLAIMMGVVTRQWMEDRRLIFWGAFLGLALTFISVDPTGFAPIIVAVTMITLFEGTLALLRWTGN